MWCKCGKEISQDRINAVTLNGKYPDWAKKLSCVSCAESLVQRKAGYMVSSQKMVGELVIASQETVKQFHKAAARTNGIVANGVRFKKAR